MYIKKEVDFRDLEKMVWSGAVDTLNTIYNNDKEDELMYLLEEEFGYEMPTETEVNDFLWFEDEYIFERLGIKEDDEVEEDKLFNLSIDNHLIV